MDAEVETKTGKQGTDDKVASKPEQNTVAELPARPAPYTAGAGGAGGRTKFSRFNLEPKWPQSVAILGGGDKDRPTGDPNPSR